MLESISKLEEEALKRKDRIRQLANKRKSQSDEISLNNSLICVSREIPRPVFQNYRSESEDIKDALANKCIGNVQAEITKQLEMMKTSITIEDIDIANLAPRKPDWDLKRDVAKKLEKLDRKTQKAIAELIRERLKEGQEHDMLLAVNVASSSAGVARHSDKN